MSNIFKFRSDLSYSLAGATVSDNETYSLFTSSEDRPITSASEDHPMSSPLSDDDGGIGGGISGVANITEHLTDTTTTDSITEKCDSMTLREVESFGAKIAGVSSQESLEGSFYRINY